MVGRTLFSQPALRWLRAEIDDAELIRQARDNFETLIDIWQRSQHQ